MINKLGLMAITLLCLGAVISPPLVSAERNPLASPAPQQLGRITAPEISGFNPEVDLSEGKQGDTHPSDIFSPLDLQRIAGLFVPKGMLLASVDSFLSGMRFFSVLSIFLMAVSIIGRPGKDFRLFANLWRKFVNLKRKDIGGGPEEPGDSETKTVKMPRYKTKTIYRGIKTVELGVPVYETRKFQVGLRGIKKSYQSTKSNKSRLDTRLSPTNESIPATGWVLRRYQDMKSAKFR